MKLLKIILLSLSLILLSISCNDWLDLHPATSIVDSGSTIKLPSDADARLNGAYNLMRSYYYYGARMTYYGDALSEDMQAVSQNKRTGNYYCFKFLESTAPNSYWTTCYSLINYVNIILSSIDNLIKVSTESDKKILEGYKGEALTIRALAHWDLTRLYGYPYKKDNGDSWGVPIVDKVMPQNYKPYRNTIENCYNFIIDDLSKAIELLPEERVNGRFNKWAAMHLLSRVYLYKGDDEKALSYAKETIAGTEEMSKNPNHLWTREEYKYAWEEEFGSETLFELQFSATENEGKEAIGYLVAAAGYDDIVISDDWLINLMGDEQDDIRYQCVIENKKDGSKAGKRYIWKYPVNSGESSPAYYLANVKVFRLSETYLIAAEAAARSGNNEDAVKYLEPIVKRGSPNKTVKETPVTLDRVLEERRKELVGEGHRFWDAIRNGKSIVRSQNLPYPHLESDIYKGGMNFNWDFFKVVLPIPIAEINANENIATQQNPGYKN